MTNIKITWIGHKLTGNLFPCPQKIWLTIQIFYPGWDQLFEDSEIHEMPYLIIGRYFTNILPAWYFNFLCFLFLLFLSLLFLSLFFLELNSQIRKFKLNHVIDHFLNLILNFRQNSLLNFLHFRFILSTRLIFPLFSVFINIMLNGHNCLSWSTSWIIFLKLLLLSQFLLFLLSFLFFLLHLGQLRCHLLLLGTQWDFDLVLFIVVFRCIRDFGELVPLHKLTDPQSTVSQHFLFHRLLPFLLKFLF